MTEADAGPKDGSQTVIEGARQELRTAAGELAVILNRLRVVQASLPASLLEMSQEDLAEGDPDVATELRSVIGVGIHDYLEPLIRNLLTAAGSPG